MTYAAPPRQLQGTGGVCWCGQPLDLKAGHRFDDGTKWVWARCTSGHLTKEREIPRNLGSKP